MPSDWQLNAPQLLGSPGYGGDTRSGSGVNLISPQQELYGGVAVAPQVNQSNLNYLALGIPNYSGLAKTESGNINNLLNPTDFTDVQRRAAEQAVAGGFQGSGVADALGLRMTEEEKIRRQMLGSQMLSGAAARLPAAFNPASFLGRGTSPSLSPSMQAPLVSRSGPGGGSPGGPRPELPGQPPNPVLPGTATPHNWLSDIISRYSPEGGSTPAYQMQSGVGPGFNAQTDEYGFPLDYAQEVAQGSGEAAPAPQTDEYGFQSDWEE